MELLPTISHSSSFLLKNRTIKIKRQVQQLEIFLKILLEYCGIKKILLDKSADNISQNQIKFDMTSSFRQKLTIHKEMLNRQSNIEEDKNLHHVCSATELKIKPNSPRSELCIKEPIYICKKEKKKEIEPNRKKTAAIKKVEPYVPIQIPKSPPSGSKKFEIPTPMTQCSNKEIQIHIQKDSKECLKKLFKKIHKLSQDLAESEKQRIRLQLQLNNLRQVDGFNRNQEKDLLRLEGDNFKLKAEVDLLRSQLKDKNSQINQIKTQVPQQIVKQIVVEKPVEVKVEVPRYVPGPQRTVEVIKYVDNSSDKIEIQALKNRISSLQDQLDKQQEKYRKRIPEVVQKPIYLQKPVYIQKPIYVDRPSYQSQSQPLPQMYSQPLLHQNIVQVPIEIPYQVPIYIQKPVFDEQLILKMRQLEESVQVLLRQNEEIRNENGNLRVLLGRMHNIIELLKRHNFQKNHEVEVLLSNIADYSPMKGKSTVKVDTRVIRNPGRSGLIENDTFNPRR